MPSRPTLITATPISKDDALAMLKSKISYAFKIKDMAAMFNVSCAFMSAVLSGKKQMTEPMLDHIGVERTVTYWLRDCEDKP